MVGFAGACIVGGKIYFGTVMKFGYIEKDGKDVDAWCVKFDRKIVTYINSRGKGHKEDFVFEELETAIELYEKHEEEDKNKCMWPVPVATVPYGEFAN